MSQLGDEFAERPVGCNPRQLGVEEVGQAHPGPGGPDLQFPVYVVGYVTDLDHLAHPFTIVHVHHMSACDCHVQTYGVGVTEESPSRV